MCNGASICAKRARDYTQSSWFFRRAHTLRKITPNQCMFNEHSVKFCDECSHNSSQKHSTPRTHKRSSRARTAT